MAGKQPSLAFFKGIDDIIRASGRRVNGYAYGLEKERRLQNRFRGGESLIIAMVNEILFGEMIQKTAAEEQADCLVLVEEETLLAALPEGTPSVLFMDIGLSSLDGPSLIQKLKQNPSTRKIPIVVFGNSLRADLMQDAKEMGADLVLPKAAFREQLPGLIRHYDKHHG